MSNKTLHDAVEGCIYRFGLDNVGWEAAHGGLFALADAVEARLKAVEDTMAACAMPPPDEADTPPLKVDDPVGGEAIRPVQRIQNSVDDLNAALLAADSEGIRVDVSIAINGEASAIQTVSCAYSPLEVRIKARGREAQPKQRLEVKHGSSPL